MKARGILEHQEGLRARPRSGTQCSSKEADALLQCGADIARKQAFPTYDNLLCGLDHSCCHGVKTNSRTCSAAAVLSDSL